MWSWIGLTVAGLLVVGIGLWVALVVSMRTQYAPALTAIRRMNRRFTNPRVMRAAGKPRAPGRTWRSKITGEGRRQGPVRVVGPAGIGHNGRKPGLRFSALTSLTNADTREIRHVLHTLAFSLPG